MVDTDTILKETLERLRNDLAYAAPEIWLLHVQRRMEEFASEIEEACVGIVSSDDEQEYILAEPVYNSPSKEVLEQWKERGLIRSRPASVEGERRSATHCSAIWNGCICGRPRHDVDDRHVWLNTLDHNRAVDPAQYPAALPASTESGSRVDVLDKTALELRAIRVREYDGEDWVSMADLAYDRRRTAPSEPEAPKIDPSWCDCPEGYSHIGIDKYKHLPSCRYGIIEDWLDIQG